MNTSTPEQPASFVSAVGRFARSPGFKFFLLAVLILILLIPSLLVWGLVSERKERADSAAGEIGNAWGGPQTLNGPFLIVPVQVDVTSTRNEVTTTSTDTHYAIFLPDDLMIDGKSETEIRRRGIFDVPVYRADLNISGRFSPPDVKSVRLRDGRFIWTDAVVALGIASVKAIKDTVAMEINGGTTVLFDPSLGVPGNSLNGIHARLGDRGPALAASGFTFAIDLPLNGSRELFVTPAARSTALAFTSDWPHPSFTGTFLPDDSDIGADGFSAQWQVPHLARSVPQTFLLDDKKLELLQSYAFGVRFYQPINYYALVNRSLKYAVMFISVVFLCVFVLEVRSGKRVHMVQYVFVGLTMILFYVLLLAIAEHLGFSIAYVIAALATAMLISIYCAVSLDSTRSGAALFILLVAVLTVLYAFLRLEDYALLAGSVFAFVVLAISMFSTRKVDWSGQAGHNGSDSAMPRGADLPLKEKA